MIFFAIVALHPQYKSYVALVVALHYSYGLRNQSWAKELDDDVRPRMHT